MLGNVNLKVLGRHAIIVWLSVVVPLLYGIWSAPTFALNHAAEVAIVSALMSSVLTTISYLVSGSTLATGAVLPPPPAVADVPLTDAPMPPSAPPVQPASPSDPVPPTGVQSTGQ